MHLKLYGPLRTDGPGDGLELNLSHPVPLSEVIGLAVQRLPRLREFLPQGSGDAALTRGVLFLQGRSRLELNALVSNSDVIDIVPVIPASVDPQICERTFGNSTITM